MPGYANYLGKQAGICFFLYIFFIHFSSKFQDLEVERMVLCAKLGLLPKFKKTPGSLKLPIKSTYHNWMNRESLPGGDYSRCIESYSSGNFDTNSHQIRDINACEFGFGYGFVMFNKHFCFLKCCLRPTGSV